ncbi:MAG: N-acetylmuramoyl-L-alanine amidase [Pseudomonadota bacterium]
MGEKRIPRNRVLGLVQVIILAAAAGCVSPSPDVYSPLADPDDQEQMYSRDEIAAQWTRDGDWLVSPILDAPLGASRVGALIQLVDERDMPAVEARIIVQDEYGTDWIALGVTWSESIFYVATADFGTAGIAGQLRLHVDAVDAIRLLQFSAVVPGDPDYEQEQPEEDPGTQVFEIRSELRGLGIVTREEWGARSTRCSSTDSKTRMAVHYTVTPSENPQQQVRAIQRYHMDSRGWCDIGYHFLVGIDGSIYEGRPLHLIGAHVGGQNTGNIGISFIGCFHPSGCSSYPPPHPPEVMIDAGGRLLGTLSNLFGITLNTDRVRGHRDYPGASTNCPGDNLAVRLDDMLAIGQRSSLDSPPDDSPPEEPPAEDPPPDGSCEGLNCAWCETAAGCGWCAAAGGCIASSDGCAWRGEVGADVCWDTLWPCSTATCWNPSEALIACGAWSKDEDFSSGRYSVHRYWVTLPAGGPLTLRLERTGGSFSPALLVTDRSGGMVYGGEAKALHADVAVRASSDGRGAGAAEVTLEAERDLDALVYVTGWEILDAGFSGALSTSSRYRLSATQDCSGGDDPPDDPPPDVTCTDLACGACEAAAGCGWCSALGACGAGADACTWRGEVGTEVCWDTLWPCGVASCWDPSASFTTCGAWTMSEDFSSGRFSVHRYSVTLPAGGPLTLRLERTAGDFAPALLVSDRAGALVYGGETAALHPDVAVVDPDDGRGGSAARVTLEAARDMSAYVYVTGWDILDAGFRGSLPTSVRYRFSATHDCSGGEDPPEVDGVYGGLTQSGSEIPRSGLYNGTLRSTLGISYEPYGEVVTYEGSDWVRGGISWFGGPDDMGVGPTETCAITGEIARQLNDPVNPAAGTLASRPEDYYYAAMRWNYSPNGRTFWQDVRIVVTNPVTGVQIVVRPVDWGPNTSTGRIIDLSPQSLADLGLLTDDFVLVAFARPDTPLGVVP